MKPIKVKFQFDERSLITREEAERRGLDTRGFDLFVPHPSTCPPTADEPLPTPGCNALAVIAPSFPSECPSERQDRNLKAALAELRRLESQPCETGDLRFLRQYVIS